MRKYLYFSLVLIFLLCPIFSSSEIIESIVAKVNNEVITLTEFEEFLDFIVQKQGIMNVTKELKEQVLDVLIDEILLFQLAESKQIYIYEDEIEKELERIKRASGPFETEEDWNKYIEKNIGTDNPTIIKKEIKKSITVSKLFQYYVSTREDSGIEPPSDKEIKEYYEENMERFIQKDRVRLSHILFKFEKGNIAEYENSLEKAEAVVNQLKKNEIDFVSAVRMYSEDSETKKRSGDLNYFTPEKIKETFPKVADFILNNDVGSITEPFETEEGIQILKITDKVKGRTRPFEEVRSQIIIMILENETGKIINEKVEKMRLTSRIEKMLNTD